MHPVYARNNLQVYVVAVCVLKIEKKLISNAAMTDFIKLFIKFSYMREPTSHLAMLKVLRYSSTVNFPIVYTHWRRSGLNSAGALQGGGQENSGNFGDFYTINFRGERKSGGAHAPAAPASSAPMFIPQRLHQDLDP